MSDINELGVPNDVWARMSGVPELQATELSSSPKASKPAPKSNATQASARDSGPSPKKTAPTEPQAEKPQGFFARLFKALGG